jgi:hypothetical protein
MITVYNPLTGEWERLDDVVRPLPVIARDTRLVAVNDTTSFIPTLASNNSNSHTDIFGSTNSSRANIGIAVGSTDADILIPDPWRIRRFIVVANRTASGGTSVSIVCNVYGRLLAPDGTPTGWRRIIDATETGSTSNAIRFVMPSSLTGVQGYDQYRIVFRRDPDSTPNPELSLIRVYAEF